MKRFLLLAFMVVETVDGACAKRKAGVLMIIN